MTKDQMKKALENKVHQNYILQARLDTVMDLLQGKDEVLALFIDTAFALADAADEYFTADMDSQQEFDRVYEKLIDTTVEFNDFADKQILDVG